MTYKYGIDFGTTNSSIAIRYYDEKQKPQTVVVEVKQAIPRETIPSVVLADEFGGLIAGEQAVEQYFRNADRKEQRLIKLAKLKLEKANQENPLTYPVGEWEFSGEEVIAAIFKVLRLKAEKEAKKLNIQMDGVVLGVPVQYGDYQKTVLMQSLVHAGFYTTYEEAKEKTVFVSEPLAVAVHYGFDLQKDKTVLIFDFGGGTLDVAIVDLKENLKENIEKRVLHPHEVTAKERLTLGGEELTRLFFIHSFCSSKKYGTKTIAAAFGLNKNLTPDKLWEQLLQSPEGVQFIAAIDLCKCKLSSKSEYVFTYRGVGVDLQEKTFGQDDFISAIQEKRKEIDELVMRCLHNGGINDPNSISDVILAGGSSMIPAIQKQLEDRFGYKKVQSKTEEEVLTSIVRGLAVVGAERNALFQDVVDCDYGVRDDVKKDMIVIIKKGMPVKDTIIDQVNCLGCYEEVDSILESCEEVNIQIYQRGVIGQRDMGTITIQNLHGVACLHYKVFMTIEPSKGMLRVMLYDCNRKEWREEIPLQQREFNITERG